MNDRPDFVECPTCAGPARRMISSPNLARSGAAMALQDATRATADQPAVVSSPASAGRRQKVTTNPLHQKLPRN